MLAAIEELERDSHRLAAAFVSTNRNPRGACAITGTGFPIDRNRTSELLGFDGPTGNTFGSIATVDYLLESAAAATVTLVGVGRMVQDFLLWCTMEMGYLRLLVANAFRDATRAVGLVAAAMEHAEFNVALMRRAGRHEWRVDHRTGGYAGARPWSGVSPGPRHCRPHGHTRRLQSRAS